MKKIRILALLVIVVFVAEVIMSNGTADFRRGWNSAGNSRELKFSTVDISIKAEKNIAVDSLFNSVIQQNVPCRMSSLETEIQPSFINKLILMLAFPLVLFTLYGFYCMIRVVISVSRGKVFTRENVNRMHLFVYSIILLGICMETYEYLLHKDAVSQIQFSGYELTSYALTFSWFSYLILALFTEIFAVGVKMKEEQDLTI